MNAYTVEITDKAQRDFDSLSEKIQHRILQAINSLENNPWPAKAKTITLLKDHYRICIGDYRVIYKVDQENNSVVIVRMGPRKDVYRFLKTYKPPK